MKKESFAALALVLTMAGGALAEGAYTPGVYEGQATGFGGDVRVRVEVSESAITEVSVLGDQETPAIGGAALEMLRVQIMEKQSAEIDGVSGATVTTGGVKAAAQTALALARGEDVETTFEAQPLPEGLVLGENEYYGMDEHGAGGTVAVVVTLDGDTIVNVKVIEQHETRGLGTNGLLETIEQIKAANSTDVDGVAGATLSSSALKRAVSRALVSAGK